ncbi:hypothetical protein PAECIP111891_06019 [Paenibacillus allorhizoplanae]|uniref:Uncharacterized protein n=1 Tax=Paenibacillus allorhizoplanae TaxID=2905648 RepID=A0ABN8HAZ2_9BACL|nr:hypothetical protein [Paenibacillus allorhizoplanae]CAH1226880.1 hypothetical protein PAECIP111891_06019 [Paenibacillus allorhizoplanae]
MKVKKKNFKSVALEIAELFELSIEHVGFPYSKREFINAFYDSKFNEDGERIKTRIIDVEYYYLGGTNFKDKSDPKNKVLFEKLSSELRDIKEALENYPDK